MWTSFLLVICVCVFFSFIRNGIYKEKYTITLIVLMGVISGVSVFFLDLLLNMAGIDYYIIDEVILSAVYVLVGPMKFMDGFE